MNKKQYLFYGQNSITETKSLIKKICPKKIFLVTAKKSYKLSGSELLIKKIIGEIPIIRFYNFSENPKIEDVEKGIKIFRKYKCDFIIAIGGGSVIDMAKLINAGQSEDQDLKSIIYNKLDLKIEGKKILAIPTTAGAGSEATHFAVVYINKVKYSLTSPTFLIPKYVLLKPELTFSLSKYQIAVSGIDALSQAIESYWSVNSTSISRKYSEKAIKLILKNLNESQNNNLIAKKNILYASYLSGKAINITKTTGAHALSYSFTSMFDIPHGHAVALTLPSWFKYNLNVSSKNINDKRGVKFTKKIMSNLTLILEKYIIEGSLPYEKILYFIKSLGLKNKLSDFNISKNDINFFINNVNIERLDNNPSKITRQQLFKLIDEIS
jgi:alcohol dehydrogenase class IV